MGNELNDEHTSAIAELRLALAALEAGEELEQFVDGHGLQSRFFAFSWRSDGLAIDFRLPYARVLSDEGGQKQDVAEIGAAIRLAILLLVSSVKGTLLREGEAAISVEADETGVSYSIFGADGEEIDSGEAWEPVVARLDSAFADGGGEVQVVWP